MQRVVRRLGLFGLPPVAMFEGSHLDVEQAPRDRAARLVRGALREGRPVILRHARWAAVRWLMQDVAADLACGEPPLHAHLVDFGMEGDAEDTWSRVPDILARVLGAGGGFRALVPTTADGFRERAAAALRKGRDRRRRRALLCLEADVIGHANLQAICDAWVQARDEMTPGTAPVLLLACQVGGQNLQLADAMSFFLPDPTVPEAVRMLAELLGSADKTRLVSTVGVLGPVPAFLLAAARAGAPRNRSALVEALGPLHRELAQVVEMAVTEPVSAARLELLAHSGAQPHVPGVDDRLQRMGLVSVRDQRGRAMAQVRSPLIRELIG